MPRRTAFVRRIDELHPIIQRIARSKKFEASLDLLCMLGLSTHAIEHYLWMAHETRRLPHELVRDLIEEHVKRADAIVAASLNSGDPA
ncbi:MAG TPA: hypothetical protein VEP50_02965 [bacterium]|nr:hypothetical protein [bacterium]